MKKTNKVKVVRQKKVKYDLSKYADAIVENVFTAPVGSKIIVARDIDGKIIHCVCEVKSIKNNEVSTWDETTVRWFSFNLCDDIVVKLLKEVDNVK